MTEGITFKLQASNVYFGLSIIVHGFTLLSVWLYSFNIYASLAFSLALVVHFQKLSAYIFLNKPSSIHTFALQGQSIITTDNAGVQQKYPYVYCVYQSRLLVIIKIGKCSLIIFKDSVVNHPLSQLNRLLNA
ncbi:hypothetical protein [uncultured Gammaproteobacteria bacterium]|nr:hypothetical protein [uncultured Gammaproteobacteria bacterium]CAC9606077.1 hypothetical protein [uncultured Gammaproteobacteria bacterium]SHN91281.1 hypothetical protein BHECKSOX_1500 [Bathymodiolus heckerae thiotrophic gill symbiont]